MNYYELALRRRSTRSFKTKKVGPALLNQLHEYAPHCRTLLEDAPSHWLILSEDVSARLAAWAGYTVFMV